MLTKKESDVLIFLKKKRNTMGKEHNKEYVNILFQGMMNGIRLCAEKLDFKTSESFMEECNDFLSELIEECENF